MLKAKDGYLQNLNIKLKLGDYRMDSENVKTSKTENCPLDLEDEFAASIIRGIEDYRAGRGKSFNSIEEVMDYLRSL